MMQRSGPRVVHVSSVHPYTDNRIHYRECNSLAGAGYDVTLIAVESAVNGPATNVRVVATPRRSRLARMVVGSFSAVRMALRSGARIVHLHDPELIPYIPLLRAAGRTVIYDAHEDLPLQVLNKSYVRPTVAPVVSLFAKALIRIASTSSYVICATEAIATRYPKAKTAVVHNYPPLRESERSASARDINAREPWIVYVGGIGETRGASVMVDAMAQPTMPADWRLRIAGTVAPALLDSMRQMDGWRRVDFEGQVPSDEARDLILGARIGLVLFADSAAHRDALPTKMFEYFAAGVPVIASDFPLWRTIVTSDDCGVLVDPKSPAEIALAVNRYAADPALLAEHSRNARRIAVERLNWENESRTLLEVYATLSDERLGG